MTRTAFSLVLALPLIASAQMKHDSAAAKPGAMEEIHHAPSAPSTKLVVTGMDGKAITYSPEDVKNMMHMTVHVHNAHSNVDETYSGVPVSEFAKRAEPMLATGEKPKVSPRVTVLVFGATDKFRVVLTACDIDPSCHNGMVIVADQIDGKPLDKDGAFKLIITEDKKPGRWAHNLESITLKAVE